MLNQTTNKNTPPKKITWLLSSFLVTLIAAFSFIFWRVIKYWYRLFNQPTLTPLVVPTLINAQQNIQSRALFIATENLQAGIEKRRLLNGEEKFVLCAGLRNFREPWARDLSFASFGLVELSQFQVVKEALSVFFINQRPSGQLPVKVHGTNILDRYLHSLFKKQQSSVAPIKPKYVTGHNTISLDGNALLVIASLNYATCSKDTEFIQTNWSALKQAITWLEGHATEAGGLLHQAPFADWADSVGRQGKILYTNVIYWKALTDLAQTAATYGYTADHSYFTSRANHIKTLINNHFWRDDLGYYITNNVFSNLSSPGNLLAIAWNLATDEQAHAILDKMNEFQMANPVPTQVAHPEYPKHIIALENRLASIPFYHTKAAWLWIGAWHIIALTHTNRLSEADELLSRMAQAIARDGTIHEVYGLDGQYVSSFWYTSEAPLTWSAGMIVYAYQVYQKHINTA